MRGPRSNVCSLWGRAPLEFIVIYFEKQEKKKTTNEK